MIIFKYERWLDLIYFIWLLAECPSFIMSLQMQSQINILTNSSQLLKAVLICINQLLNQSQMHPHIDSPFNLRAAPTISISDYLARMIKYMNASPSTFIYSLILIDRAQENHPDFILNSKNVHRLLLTANAISAKYQDDFFYKNSYYANVGGVNVALLNTLELEFLAMIGFNCHVEEGTFLAYVERLELFLEINNRGETEKENAKEEKGRAQRRTVFVKKERNGKQSQSKQHKKVEKTTELARSRSFTCVNAKEK